MTTIKDIQQGALVTEADLSRPHIRKYIRKLLSEHADGPDKRLFTEFLLNSMKITHAAAHAAVEDWTASLPVTTGGKFECTHCGARHIRSGSWKIGDTVQAGCTEKYCVGEDDASTSHKCVDLIVADLKTDPEEAAP